MNPLRDTLSRDGACVYEVSLNYLEWIKSYGPEKQKGPYLTFDLEL
jgi:hypothetical protein